MFLPYKICFFFFFLGSPEGKLPYLIQWNIFFLLMLFLVFLLSVCEYKRVQSSHSSLRPSSWVLLLKVPGTNIRCFPPADDCRFVTSTQRALFLLLGGFFSLSEAGVRGLCLPGVNLCPSDLHHLWVPGWAPPSLRSRHATLWWLAYTPPLWLWFAGGASSLSAFLPSFILLGFVVGWAGAFPFLLVCRGAVAGFFLLRWGWSGVIPRADLHHQGGRLEKTPSGLGVVWVEPLWFPISGCDAFLTPDPVWRDGVWISQHGLLFKLPGTDVWFEREGRPGRTSFARFSGLISLSSFVFGAASVGGGLARFLPLLRTATFGDPRAAAPSAAWRGFHGSDGDVFLGLSLRGSLRFIHLPGTHFRHVIEAPASLWANGWLAATHLFKNKPKHNQWANHSLHLSQPEGKLGGKRL